MTEIREVAMEILNLASNESLPLPDRHDRIQKMVFEEVARHMNEWLDYPGDPTIDEYLTKIASTEIG